MPGDAGMGLAMDAAMNLLFANDRRGEYPPSLYAATRPALSPFPEQRGEARADVVIVGGGYTGLSAALHLAEAGLDVMLLEAHRMGFGASGRNGGQLGSGQRLEVDELEKMAGAETAHRLWDMAEEAKALAKAHKNLKVDILDEKKLKELAVDDATYQRSMKERCRISSVHNYYGMAEQLGSVYVTCEHGHMHASNFSEVLIRNPLDWSLQSQGERGLIELVSVLPGSYPGHAILTEDEGVILGEDDCPCGRHGKYFRFPPA